MTRRRRCSLLKMNWINWPNKRRCRMHENCTMNASKWQPALFFIYAYSHRSIIKFIANAIHFNIFSFKSTRKNNTKKRQNETFHLARLASLKCVCVEMHLPERKARKRESCQQQMKRKIMSKYERRTTPAMQTKRRSFDAFFAVKNGFCGASRRSSRLRRRRHCRQHWNSEIFIFSFQSRSWMNLTFLVCFENPVQL